MIVTQTRAVMAMIENITGADRLILTISEPIMIDLAPSLPLSCAFVEKQNADNPLIVNKHLFKKQFIVMYKKTWL